MENPHLDLLVHFEFLHELDAGKTKHSGRTLFEHLKGVHDLLRDWDHSEDVCLAGLYHSIYGTKSFKHASLLDRDQLAVMIGEHAEMLVYLFSSADRPLFRSIAEPKIRAQLLEIEAANALEQRNGEKTLAKLMATRILSNGARSAINSRGM